MSSQKNHPPSTEKSGSSFIVNRKDILQARFSGELKTMNNLGKNKVVKDWMLPGANMISVEPEVTLPHAYEIMQENQLDRLPVVAEEGDQQRLLGTITEGIVKRYLPSQVPVPPTSSWQISQSMPQVAVSDVMKLNPATITPEATLTEASEMMLAKQIDSIPVTDEEGVLLGIIRLQDILHMVARS